MTSLPRPAVLPWYRAYCGVCLAFYAGMVALGVWAARAPQPDAVSTGIAIGAVGALGALAFVASFAVPRRPWGWSAHAALIVFGMALCVTIPTALLVMQQWLRPETKAWFADAPGSAPPSAGG